MYLTVLTIHSWLRWIVIAAGLTAIVRGGTRTAAAGRWFTILLDVQILLGLLLYFVLSPFPLTNYSQAMQTPQLRFFSIEHVFGMLIGTALAHIGRSRVLKAAPERKARVALIFYGLAMVAILASIPWPGMSAGRPLFRS